MDTEGHPKPACPRLPSPLPTRLQFLTADGVLADVSLSAGTGAVAAARLKAALGRHRGLRTALLVLRTFFAQRNLANVAKGGLGSHALALTAIAHADAEAAAGRDTSAGAAGELVLSFLRRLGTLDAAATAVAPGREGGFVPRADVQGATTPPAGERRLCVEDPDTLRCAGDLGWGWRRWCVGYWGVRGCV